MGLFDNIFKKKPAQQSSAQQASAPLTSEEKYGKAWIMIVGQNRQQGLQLMRELDATGFVEASIALAMFSENPADRKRLAKKAADAGNPEGLWEYCGFLPHSYCPNPTDKQDALWERYCTHAAEAGSAVCSRCHGAAFDRCFGQHQPL